MRSALVAMFFARAASYGVSASPVDDFAFFAGR
jgi:hypothetical protein